MFKSIMCFSRGQFVCSRVLKAVHGNYMNIQEFDMLNLSFVYDFWWTFLSPLVVLLDIFWGLVVGDITQMVTWVLA